ncbi:MULTISPECIES: hypothetical protein [unclassified Devosia]|uniref:hypothetical protein n=1 Tax=unclassified Devosia TaxID=196773 RepID=UPI0025DA500A|nr:hypothetical protein [Devosia sp.]MCR6636695.1 hypothetical protein [Devosia sp.]
MAAFYRSGQNVEHAPNFRAGLALRQMHRDLPLAAGDTERLCLPSGGAPQRDTVPQQRMIRPLTGTRSRHLLAVVRYFAPRIHAPKTQIKRQ